MYIYIYIYIGTNIYDIRSLAKKTYRRCGRKNLREGFLLSNALTRKPVKNVNSDKTAPRLIRRSDE